MPENMEWRDARDALLDRRGGLDMLLDALAAGGEEALAAARLRGIARTVDTRRREAPPSNTATRQVYQDPLETALLVARPERSVVHARSFHTRKKKQKKR
jgi:hypothetical protein